MRKFLVAAIVCASVFSSAQDKNRFGNVEAITPERLRAHLEFIAHDLLEGRDTPSRGLDIACWYVATQLKLWGAKPAGDNGTFFQNIAIVRPAVNTDKTTFLSSGKQRKFGDGFLSTATSGKAAGSLVFVGDGYEVPDLGADPYKGLDVRGKIVVRTMGYPKGFSNRDAFQGKYKNYRNPVQAAKAHGAVGVIQLAAEDVLARWDDSVARATRPGFPQIESPSAIDQLPVVTVKPELGREIFESEAVTVEDVLKRADTDNRVLPFAMKVYKTVEFEVVGNDNRAITQNVVAIVPGTDPVLSKEYVAVGCHIDHVGKREGMEGDNIFNGADDDGSGTVSILEIAHGLLTGPRPKRSVLFVWHTGEEKGLWGSAYFANNPSVPITSIVAQLNIDMIGRSKKAGDTNARNKMLTDENSIYVVGSRKLSNQLGDVVAAVNQGMYKLRYDYHYDAPNDPENIYQRSDHYNYAAKGIPIAFWFDGVHEDYHQRSDHADKIDYQKMSKIARTILATAFTLGNNVARPKVDAPR